MSHPVFHRPILIYLPCYNCTAVAGEVVRGIPAEFRDNAEVLLIDNHSPDGTGPALVAAFAATPPALPCRVIRTRRNLGYAGSQKLAYEIALASPAVEHVIMLHGDGQYPPELTRCFLPQRDAGYDIVYGYRSKLRFGRREETPIPTFAMIRILSILESIVTRAFRKEWHTGFMMYSTRFLRRVPLQLLTETPHIDGHLLYAGKVFAARVRGIPIFKRYKDLVAFEGPARAQYVRDVFRLMFRFQAISLSSCHPEKIHSAADYEALN